MPSVVPLFRVIQYILHFYVLDVDINIIIHLSKYIVIVYTSVYGKHCTYRPNEYNVYYIYYIHLYFFYSCVDMIYFLYFAAFHFIFHSTSSYVFMLPLRFGIFSFSTSLYVCLYPVLCLSALALNMFHRNY